MLLLSKVRNFKVSGADWERIPSKPNRGSERSHDLGRGLGGDRERIGSGLGVDWERIGSGLGADPLPLM